MKVLLKNCTPIRTTPWFILVMIIWDVQPHLSEGKKLLIPELAADKRWKNLDLPKPKRIDSTVSQNLQCGFSLELGHVNEDNYTMNDLYQLLDNLKSTERVIDVRTPNEYSQGHVPGSLNIPMGNEQSFLEELSSYQRIFVHCHSGRRAQTVYTMLGMQCLENVVCINSSGMADWTIAGFPVER